MAFQPGHGSYLLLDTNDWSSYMDSESLDQVRDTLETTAFGDGARTYIAGLQSGSISLSGPWDSVLDGYVIATNDGAVVAYEFGPEGSSGVKKSGNALFTDYSVSTSVDGRVEWSASFQPTGAITTGTFQIVAGDGAVPIKGLKELRRGLKHYNGNINKTVKKAHTRVANLVIKEAPKAAGRRGPSRGPAGSTRGAQRLAQSFRPVQSAKSAKIRSPLPDAYGQEYGSRRFLRFPAYRGFDNGAVGERAVSDNREEIGEEYLEAIFDALKEAYPDG